MIEAEGSLASYVWGFAPAPRPRAQTRAELSAFTTTDQSTALAGGVNCIGNYRPILLVEIIKTDKNKLRAWLESLDYSVIEAGMNFLALHKTDKCLAEIQIASKVTP